MVARHGRVARLPASRRDPELLDQTPVAGAALAGLLVGRERVARAELLRLGAELLGQPTPRERWRRAEAMTAVLDWLERFPGDTWQERWLLSGADEHPRSWGPPGLTPRWRNRLTTGLGVLIVLRAVRPAYRWLFASRLLGVYASYRQHNRIEDFAELAERARRRGGSEHETEALNALTRMVIVTGKALRDLDLDDLMAYAAERKASGRKVASLPAAYELLRDLGGLKTAPPTWQHAQARGPLSAAELVDRYPIACRPVRDVFVHYLVERSAVLDYGSLDNQAQMLVSLFWADLERHHPGISSLHLPPEVAHAWKQRIRALPDGRSRRNFHAVLLTVRAFYLDLLQWSLEDPARWAPWAAPCPISEADVRGYVKETRQRRARMAQRTRTLAPTLPRLVAAAEQHLASATRLLHAADAATPGAEFVADGVRYLRVGPRRRDGPSPVRLLAQPLDAPAAGSTSRSPRTTRFGPGRSSRCCAEPASGSRNCSS